jgi:hypothetical protein
VLNLQPLVTADIPVLLWGAPGTGKTSQVNALAKTAGAHCETLIGSTLDPTDVCRQVLVRGKLRHAAPDWVDRIVAAQSNGQLTWLFLDELSCTPPSVQAALLRVVEERRVANVDIRGCRILAAANPTDQAADGYELSAAASNRWCHLDWRVDSAEWIAGELGGWGHPEQALAESRASVTGWIDKSPGALLQPPGDGVECRGWASPRSWSRVARLPSDAPMALIAGLVGPGAASEYCTWRGALDIPRALDVLAGTATVPDRGDLRYTVLTACTALAVSDRTHLSALWRLLVAQRKDHALVAARRALSALKAAGLQIGQDYEITRDLSRLTEWVQR